VYVTCVAVVPCVAPDGTVDVEADDPEYAHLLGTEDLARDAPAAADADAAAKDEAAEAPAPPREWPSFFAVAPGGFWNIPDLECERIATAVGEFVVGRAP